ncbi:unnamed protein product, partial [Coregonus sp. 'balchen']
MTIERTHRTLTILRPGPAPHKPRPILVKFLRYTDREKEVLDKRCGHGGEAYVHETGTEILIAISRRVLGYRERITTSFHRPKGGKENGTKKSWDFMRTHDSVSVLIFNTTSHCFILVKQFRPAVYMCEWERTKAPEPAEQAAAVEEEEGTVAVATAASETPIGETPQEEAAATAGGVETPQPPGSAGMTYELCAGLVDKADLSLEEIARQEVLEESGVGVTGAKQTMFYAEVSDENRVGEGGGAPEEGELIEVVKVPLHEAMTFAYDESIPKTMGVIFSFIWFHNNMSP